MRIIKILSPPRCDTTDDKISNHPYLDMMTAIIPGKIENQIDQDVVYLCLRGMRTEEDTCIVGHSDCMQLPDSRQTTTSGVIII